MDATTPSHPLDSFTNRDSTSSDIATTVESSPLDSSRSSAHRDITEQDTATMCLPSIFRSSRTSPPSSRPTSSNGNATPTANTTLQADGPASQINSTSPQAGGTTSQAEHVSSQSRNTALPTRSASIKRGSNVYPIKYITRRQDSTASSKSWTPKKSILEVTMLHLKPDIAPSDPRLLRELRSIRSQIGTNSRFYIEHDANHLSQDETTDPNRVVDIADRPTKTKFTNKPWKIFILGWWDSVDEHLGWLATEDADRILKPQEKYTDYVWTRHIEAWEAVFGPLLKQERLHLNTYEIRSCDIEANELDANEAYRNLVLFQDRWLITHLLLMEILDYPYGNPDNRQFLLFHGPEDLIVDDETGYERRLGTVIEVVKEERLLRPSEMKAAWKLKCMESAFGGGVSEE